MRVKKYLKLVAYIGDSEIDDDEGKIYYSKFNGDYITRVGMESGAKFLADREITEELTHGIGFSHKNNKWYGWSHRAIYGFEVGSTCKEGDCHYVANTAEEMIDDYANFFADISEECAESHRAQCQILPDRSGIRILHAPIELPVAELDNLAGGLDNIDSLPVENFFEDAVTVQKCGRGRWTAKTMEDAKQMAQDFKEGVS